MASYAPVLYHRMLSPTCARLRRTIRGLGVEVELREVLLSRRNRAALREAAGGRVPVPCLVIAGTVVRGADEIEKYLRLRYGRPG
jgi:glutathione S-transferase